MKVNWFMWNVEVNEWHSSVPRVHDLRRANPIGTNKLLLFRKSERSVFARVWKCYEYLATRGLLPLDTNSQKRRVSHFVHSLKRYAGRLDVTGGGAKCPQVKAIKRKRRHNISASASISMLCPRFASHKIQRGISSRAFIFLFRCRVRNNTTARGAQWHGKNVPTIYDGMSAIDKWMKETCDKRKGL